MENNYQAEQLCGVCVCVGRRFQDYTKFWYSLLRKSAVLILQYR